MPLKGAGLTPEQLKQQQEQQAKALKENATIKSLNEKLAAAKTAADAGDFDTAIAQVTEATQMDPSRDLLWAKLGDYDLTSAAKQTDTAEKTKRYEAPLPITRKLWSSNRRPLRRTPKGSGCEQSSRLVLQQPRQSRGPAGQDRRCSQGLQPGGAVRPRRRWHVLLQSGCDLDQRQHQKRFRNAESRSAKPSTRQSPPIQPGRRLLLEGHESHRRRHSARRQNGCARRALPKRSRNILSCSLRVRMRKRPRPCCRDSEPRSKPVTVPKRRRRPQRSSRGYCFLGGRHRATRDSVVRLRRFCFPSIPF